LTPLQLSARGETNDGRVPYCAAREPVVTIRWVARRGDDTDGELRRAPSRDRGDRNSPARGLRGESRDRLSFPSGHTSAAFCAATLIERNSGPAAGALAYLAATATGFSRVEAGKHFPSDVLAGAAIGTLIAGSIDALHFGDGSPGEGISGSSWSLEPIVGSNGDVGLLVSWCR
jgi:membrane-associated phospholipid phosphatase